MKKLALVLSLLLPATALAETQVQVNQKLLRILGRTVPQPDLGYVINQLHGRRVYATAAELLATSPGEGVIGYALDTNAFYFRSGSTWTIATDLINPAVTATEAALLATTPADGTVGYAADTDVLWLRANGAWGSGLGQYKLILGNGGTLDNATNNAFKFSENSEDLILTMSTDLDTLSSSTGATLAVTPAMATTGLLTATGGVSTTKPMLLLDNVRFCGNGSNGGTAWYDGPVLASDSPTDFSLGSAACTANDSATEATADRPVDPYMVRKVVGMACTTQAGGTTNVGTYQLRSATADVAGAVCTVTNDNVNPKTCSVILAAPVTIAAGATLAVKNTQSGTDDMSAKAMGCVAYYTY